MRKTKSLLTIVCLGIAMLLGVRFVFVSGESLRDQSLRKSFSMVVMGMHKKEVEQLLGRPTEGWTAGASERPSQIGAWFGDAISVTVSLDEFGHVFSMMLIDEIVEVPPKTPWKRFRDWLGW